MDEVTEDELLVLVADVPPVSAVWMRSRQAYGR
jgi:hypothetical protein